MASKIDNLIRFTAQTFMQRRTALQAISSVAAAEAHGVFQNLFSELLTLVNSIKGDDVGISKLLEYVPQLVHYRPTALYSGIHEGPLFCICIFVMYPHSTIPLHSHPGMYGLLKVLHGDVLVRSFRSLNQVDFSKAPLQNFHAMEVVERMNEESPAAIVTPENNLHEIVNQENNSAIFLDVLSPRYENENCYFGARPLNTNGVYELCQIPCPTAYHTVSIPFPIKVNVPNIFDRVNRTW